MCPSFCALSAKYNRSPSLLPCADLSGPKCLFRSWYFKYNPLLRPRTSAKATMQPAPSRAVKVTPFTVRSEPRPRPADQAMKLGWHYRDGFADRHDISLLWIRQPCPLRRFPPCCAVCPPLIAGSPVAPPSGPQLVHFLQCHAAASNCWKRPERGTLKTLQKGLSQVLGVPRSGASSPHSLRVDVIGYGRPSAGFDFHRPQTVRFL